MGALGGSAGFFLGGVLTDVYGWPAVFAINVPVGLVAAFLSARLLPESRSAERPRDFDVAGAVVGTAGVVLAVYVLVGTGDAGWAPVRTVGLGALAAALVAAFLAIQRTRTNPLIPLRIFRRPTLAAATGGIALANMAIVPMVFLLSLYTQHTLGLSPFAAGLAALPLAISIATSSAVAARLLSRFGIRAITATGFAIFSLGLLWLSRVSGGPYVTEVLGPEFVIGIGGGMAFVAATIAGTARAPEAEAGMVASVFCVSQQIAGALGLALLTAVATAFTDLVDGVRVALLGAAVFAAAGVLSAVPLPGRERA
jgi:MFS family permease